MSDPGELESLGRSIRRLRLLCLASCVFGISGAGLALYTRYAPRNKIGLRAADGRETVLSPGSIYLGDETSEGITRRNDMTLSVTGGQSRIHVTDKTQALRVAITSDGELILFDERHLPQTFDAQSPQTPPGAAPSP